MPENALKAEVLVSKIKPRHFVMAFLVLLLAFVMLWSASRIKKVTVIKDGFEKTATHKIKRKY